MARTAAPYLHPKMAATEPPPQPHGIDRIEVVFVDASGKEVPFKDPPQLAAATGLSTPKHPDGAPSKQDRHESIA